MLLPARTEVARRLRRYRASERAALASPADRAARSAFEDAGYTLCVLMGKRCARRAARAAERYLRAAAPGPDARRAAPGAPDGPGAGHGERAPAGRYGPPVTDRRFPAGT